MKTITIILTLTLTTKIFGQNITINPGVDTTDKDINAVITLWSNYIKSNPSIDNIKNSVYWADTENNKYPKVDQLLYTFSGYSTTYSMGRPTIIYVKPKEDFYEIRTLFGTSDSLKNISVLVITSVYAKKENGEYKLYNALTVNSASWQTQKVSDVTFHFPAYHKFNSQNASTLIRSIDTLKKQWSLESIPIDYYFANTFEEIDHLRGIDYQMGMGNKDKPSGMSDITNNIVYCGGIGENYFHEVVHVYLNKLFPNSPLLEGLAVFYGGSMGQGLKWHLVRLNDYLKQHPELDLNEYEKFWFMDNFTNPKGTIQGLLCYIAYKNGGIEMLKELMAYDNFDTAIENVFKIKRNELNKFLREQIDLNNN